MRNLGSSTSTGIEVEEVEKAGVEAEEVEKGAIKVSKAGRIIDSKNSVNSLTDI
jgi:hypothetical protein